ncbi:MAG: hypothetical protein ACI909_002040, partial [Planctomycetota bacterium]
CKIPIIVSGRQQDYFFVISWPVGLNLFGRMPASRPPWSNEFDPTKFLLLCQVGNRIISLLSVGLSG